MAGTWDGSSTSSSTSRPIRTCEAPAIPDDVAQQTRAKYVEAYERLSDESFDAWLERTAPAG